MKLLDIVQSPWSITEAKLLEIQSIYASHLKGEKIDIAAVEARIGRPLDNKRKDIEIVDGVALIPIEGVIAKKMNLFMAISGGTSTQIVGSQIESALEDPEVKAIVLNIDSPGGTVDGTQELAEKVFSVRGRKPIISFVDGGMFSAAFWIGAAADQIIINGPTTAVGSVGVISTHTDFSRQEEARGIRTTHIVSGKFKASTSPHQPLSETGREEMQGIVDHLFSVFVQDLARFRGQTTEEIQNVLGEAQVLIGQQALNAGVVDGVSTLDQLIKTLSESDGDSHTGGGMSNLNKKGVAMSENKTQPTTPDITAETLRADHPELYESIKSEAYNRGLKEGAEKERSRIQAVKDQSMPGHEGMVEQLMFDGKTSGPEAAVQILAAEKKKKKDHSASLESDSPDVLTDPVPAEETTEDVSHLPLEEQAKHNWENKKELHGEFSSLEIYSAWFKADKEGRIKEGKTKR